MAGEKETVHELMKKYKHPVAAIRHLLSNHHKYTVSTLPRMIKYIIEKYPLKNYGNVSKATRRARPTTIKVAKKKSFFERLLI